MNVAGVPDLQPLRQQVQRALRQAEEAREWSVDGRGLALRQLGEGEGEREGERGGEREWEGAHADEEDNDRRWQRIRRAREELEAQLSSQQEQEQGWMYGKGGRAEPPPLVVPVAPPRAEVAAARQGRPPQLCACVRPAGDVLQRGARGAELQKELGRARQALQRVRAALGSFPGGAAALVRSARGWGASSALGRQLLDAPLTAADRLALDSVSDADLPRLVLRGLQLQASAAAHLPAAEQARLRVRQQAEQLRRLLQQVRGQEAREARLTAALRQAAELAEEQNRFVLGLEAGLYRQRAADLPRAAPRSRSPSASPQPPPARAPAARRLVAPAPEAEPEPEPIERRLARTQAALRAMKEAR